MESPAVLPGRSVASQFMSTDEDTAQAEIARLLKLVGPDEKSYDRLLADAISMKQATIEAEERLGVALAQIKQLEAELAHSYRNTVLVYKKIIRPIYLCFRWIPGVRQLASHVKR